MRAMLLIVIALIVFEASPTVSSSNTTPALTGKMTIFGLSVVGVRLTADVAVIRNKFDYYPAHKNQLTSSKRKHTVELRERGQWAF
jgi:hypothetical protein